MLKNNIATIAVIFGFAVIVKRITLLESKLKVFEKIKENELKETYTIPQPERDNEKKDNSNNFQTQTVDGDEEELHAEEEPCDKEEPHAEEEPCEEPHAEEEESTEQIKKEEQDVKDYEHVAKNIEITSTQKPPPHHFWKWNIFI